METNSGKQESMKADFFTKVTQVLLIPIIFFMYFYIGGMSVMATDSCGVGGRQCTALMAGIYLGWMFLLVSFIFGVIVKTFNPAKFEKMSGEHSWMVLLLPRFAIFIFLAIVMLSVAL